MTKTPNRSEFEKRAKAIKDWVTFSVRDRAIKPKSLRDKVRRYYNLIYGSEGNPGLYNPATDVAIRPRGKAFDIVRESEGQPKHRSIRVVFVETVENPLQPGKLLKPRIRIKNGKVLKTTIGVTQSFYPFRVTIESGDDATESMLSSEVARILRIAPHVKSWVVKCGKRQTAEPKSRAGIMNYLLYLLGKYADTVGDWLIGLVAYEFETTVARDDFLAEREKLRKGKSGRKASRRHRR